MKTIDAALLRDSFYEEVKAAWYVLKAQYQSDDFYAFGLFTTELASYLTLTASTEQGLMQSALEYAAHSSMTVEARLVSLRWTPADSPLHSDAENLLGRSQAIRDAGPEPYDCTDEESEVSIRTVFGAFADAVVRLDEEGVFGKGEARERLIVGIWWGDQGDEERLALATPMNSQVALDRFKKEMAAAYEYH